MTLSRKPFWVPSIPLRTNLLLCVALLNAVQILSLALIPSPVKVDGLTLAIPQPSMDSFLYVFLGNALLGTQELIPFYSTFVYIRNLYLLLPQLTMLGATWHVTRVDVVIRVFSFAYSWLEISMYSYAVAQSFNFLYRGVKKSLSVRAVLKTWCILTVGLAVAAVLEVMAMIVL